MIAVHRLPRTSFEAASGAHADDIALAVIASGQRSKVLLLLRLVVDELPPSQRRAGSLVTDALAVLETARQKDARAVTDTLSYPYVAAGLVAALRALRAGRTPEPATRFLAVLASSAAVAAGLDFELSRIPSTDTVHLPGLGTARLASGSQTVRIAARAGRVVVGGVELGDSEGWLGVRRLSGADAGLAAPVLDDLDPVRQIGMLPATPRIPVAHLALWRSRFERAIELLRTHQPGRVPQIVSVVRAVTPMTAQNVGQGSSATAWQAYGAVAATLPDTDRSFAVTLVHETQHSVLNGLSDLFELYEPASDGGHGDEGIGLFYSPWRADPRPLSGVVHGCYAFLGVVDFWARERLYAPHDVVAEYEFTKVRLQVQRALDILSAADGFTTDGHFMVEAMARYAATFDDGLPAEQTTYMAQLACDDHWVSWRLRVARPQLAFVAAAVRAWRDGDPPPLLGDVSQIAGGQEQFIPSDRIHRIGQLAGRDEPDMPNDDAAAWAEYYLLRQQLGAAVQKYGDAVRSGNGDERVWGGLALAAARLGGPAARVWREKPEVVLAVHQAVDSELGRPADPLVLAEWLAGSRPATPQ